MLAVAGADRGRVAQVSPHPGERLVAVEQDAAGAPVIAPPKPLLPILYELASEELERATQSTSPGEATANAGYAGPLLCLFFCEIGWKKTAINLCGR